jgi:hypothetical protein
MESFPDPRLTHIPNIRQPSRRQQPPHDKRKIEQDN